MLKQLAVYWAPGVADAFGEVTFASPVEVKVRWVDCLEAFTDLQGVSRLCKSKVYSEIDLQVKGVLWLSSYSASATPGLALAALTSSANPFANPNAWEIQRFDKLPTLKATKFLRTAFL